MVLVDSSSWIESIRTSGRADVRERVRSLLANGEAAWCNIVRLELWNGASGSGQKRVLRDLEPVVSRLEIDDQTWEIAIDLAEKARVAGLTAPADDVLIAACARRHQVKIEHCDEHFRLLEKLG